MKNKIKIATNIIWGLLVILIILIGFSTLPIPGNYKLYSVLSGSMEPALRKGSVVIVKPVDYYNLNDIITMSIPNSKDTVTHRITKVETVDNKTLFTTKGDANDVADLKPTEQENIVGRVMFKIPLLGYPMSFTKTKEGLVILVIIPATIIVYSEILNIKKEIKKKIQYKKAVKTRKEKQQEIQEEQEE
ncbi:signal peptidase I [Patescibacteria group bacterium]